MDELRKLIEKDIAERELIRAGIQRIKVRQLFQSVIGVLIVVMFSANYFELRKQIIQNNNIRRDLNEIIHASKLIIESQNETIDSLLFSDTLPQK